MCTALLIAALLTADPPDAGTVSADEVTRLRQDVQALRDRISQLERELADVKKRNAELEQLMQELESIHADLRSAVAQRQEAEGEAAAHAARVRSAIDSLIDLDARLARGDDDVLPIIDSASGVLEGSAHADLAAARRAITNKDLANARVYLLQAVADAELTR